MYNLPNQVSMIYCQHFKLILFLKIYNIKSSKNRLKVIILSEEMYKNAISLARNKYKTIRRIRVYC